MHTPDEAKELWCPLSRVTTPRDTSRCVADQCAMWRWHDSTRLMTHGPGITTSLLMPGAGGQHDWIPAKGFCGLAPQHAVPSAAFTITQQKP